MKLMKYIFSIIALMFTLSAAYADTVVFDGNTGLTGWTTIGAGNTLRTSDTVTAVPFKNYMTYTSPANTNDFGVDGGTWGNDAAQYLQSSTEAVLYPYGSLINGAYVGVRYTAPTGQKILSISIPKTYFNCDTDMHVKIIDANGNVKAESARVNQTEMVTGLSAANLNTTSIDIRFVNTSTGWWNAPLYSPSNGVIFNTIQLVITGAPPVYKPITYDNPNKPSKWFGYWHAYTVVNGMPTLSSMNYGNALPNVKGFTNLNHVFPLQGAIDSAIANHSYMLVDVMWWLFNQVGTADSFILKGDYLDQINGLKFLYKGYEKYIGAILPIDEPYHRNVPQADLEKAIAALKTAFPGIPIYENFAYGNAMALTSATLPAGVDWISTDLYESNGQPVTQSDVQAIVNHFKAIKSANQKILFVPPSAKLHLGTTYTDQQLANSINMFYTVMQAEPEVIGMIVFPADGCRQVEFDGIGSTIPLALAAQQAIGTQIAHEVCGDVWNGFYLFDYNRDCRVNLKDFATFANGWVNHD